MAGNGAGIALGVVLADAGAQNLRADNGGDASGHMNGRGTGEVVETEFP